MLIKKIKTKLKNFQRFDEKCYSEFVELLPASLRTPNFKAKAKEVSSQSKLSRIFKLRPSNSEL